MRWYNKQIENLNSVRVTYTTINALPSRELELVGVDALPEAPRGKHEKGLPFAFRSVCLLRKHADVYGYVLVAEVHRLHYTARRTVQKQ